MNREAVIEKEKTESKSYEVEVKYNEHSAPSDVELVMPHGGTWLYTWPIKIPLPDVGEHLLAWTPGGGGIGSLLIGVSRMDGEVISWKTTEDRDIEGRRGKLNSELRHLDEFVEKRDEMDAAYEALDPWLKLRLDKFRMTGGVEWRYRFEGYEMSAVADAPKIAELFAGQDVDDRDKLWGKIKDIEPKDVEGNDGHSGNTWGFAQLLAMYLLTDPPRVVVEHGAMTPLTGCDEYSCPHPLPREIDEGIEQLAPGWLTAQRNATEEEEDEAPDATDE